MKKNIISGVILLMAISLIGIIVVQFLWIRNAIEVKEKQFDRAAKNALVEIVEKFDKDKNVFFVKEQLWAGEPSSTITIDDNHNISYSYSFKSDSMVHVGHNEPDADDESLIISSDDESNVQIVAVSGEDEAMISVNTDGDNNYSIRTIIKLDSLKKDLNKNQHIVLSELRDSIELLYVKKAQQITEENSEIEDVINEMVIELKDIKEENDTSIDRALLESSIQTTLENKGISLAYEYSVYNPETNITYIASSKQMIDETVDYKTRLYPHRIFHKPELLLLSFPDKSKHIYGSVSWLMSGSLLFTLIIIITFYVTIRIILQQKKLSEIKSDFINNMTHEFKTPIATISLAVDSIQNKTVIEKPDKIKYFTDIIQEENKRMNSRVENVLQMSLIDKNDFNFRFEEGDFHDVIQQAAKNIELQLKQKNGMLNFQLNADNSISQLDHAHLMNIVTNLLDNALKYSLEKPEIVIATKNTENSILISVKDNGIGMEKEVHHKIFDKFFRVSKGDIHNVKGFGLGLSYVKAVILAWNGNIEVKSEPGKGSEFIISLPIK